MDSKFGLSFFLYFVENHKNFKEKIVMIKYTDLLLIRTTDV